MTRAYVICPKKGGSRVALDVCLSKCEDPYACEEFVTVPRDEMIEATNRLGIPVEHIVEGEIIQAGTAGGEPTIDPGSISEASTSLLPARTPPPPEAEVLYNRALKLKSGIESKWYELGKVLQEIFEKKFYLVYAPNWKEFCLKSFDFQWRYADYLRLTQKRCEEVGIDPDIAAEIGISKMKEIVPIITKTNKNHWIAKARKKGSTTASLNVEVRLAQGKISKDEAKKLPMKIFFSLYEGQKEIWDRAIELASRMLASEKIGLAVEMICADFLASYEGVDSDHKKAEIITNWLRHAESSMRVKIIGEVVDIDSGEIIAKRE